MTKNLYTAKVKIDTIFFIGPQGSGKGTQAKKLAERLGFFYWEMGGILRHIAGGDSDLGRTVKDLIERGVLLTDEMLLKVVAQYLDTIPTDKGIIFDGIPRRIGQAEFLINYLRDHGRKDMVTLFIDLPHEESLNRLLLRATTEGRKDDTREAIEFRLQQYEQDTVPVLNYLKQFSLLITIDGRPSIEQVGAAIDQALQL